MRWGLKGRALTSWAGALSSGRKKRGPPVTSIGRKELSETWAGGMEYPWNFSESILRASFEARVEGHPHNPRVLPDLTSQVVCQAWLQMTLDCSKNQSHPQGHGGLPTTKYVKISVPQVSCLNSYKRLPLQGPLSDKTVLAEVLPWPDIQGSGVIGLQAPTVGESLRTVVAIMK